MSGAAGSDQTYITPKIAPNYEPQITKNDNVAFKNASRDFGGLNQGLKRPLSSSAEESPFKRWQGTVDSGLSRTRSAISPLNYIYAPHNSDPKEQPLERFNNFATKRYQLCERPSQQHRTEGLRTSPQLTLPVQLSSPIRIKQEPATTSTAEEDEDIDSVPLELLLKTNSSKDPLTEDGNWYNAKSVLPSHSINYNERSRPNNSSQGFQNTSAQVESPEIIDLCTPDYHISPQSHHVASERRPNPTSNDGLKKQSLRNVAPFSRDFGRNEYTSHEQDRQSKAAAVLIQRERDGEIQALEEALFGEHLSKDEEAKIGQNKRLWTEIEVAHKAREKNRMEELERQRLREARKKEKEEERRRAQEERMREKEQARKAKRQEQLLSDSNSRIQMLMQEVAMLRQQNQAHINAGRRWAVEAAEKERKEEQRRKAEERKSEEEESRAKEAEDIRSLQARLEARRQEASSLVPPKRIPQRKQTRPKQPASVESRKASSKKKKVPSKQDLPSTLDHNTLPGPNRSGLDGKSNETTGKQPSIPNEPSPVNRLDENVPLIQTESDKDPKPASPDQKDLTDPSPRTSSDSPETRTRKERIKQAQESLNALGQVQKDRYAHVLAVRTVNDIQLDSEESEEDPDEGMNTRADQNCKTIPQNQVAPCNREQINTEKPRLNEVNNSFESKSYTDESGAQTEEQTSHPQDSEYQSQLPTPPASCTSTESTFNASQYERVRMYMVMQDKSQDEEDLDPEVMKIFPVRDDANQFAIQCINGYRSGSQRAFLSIIEKYQDELYQGIVKINEQQSVMVYVTSVFKASSELHGVDLSAIPARLPERSFLVFQILTSKTQNENSEAVTIQEKCTAIPGMHFSMRELANKRAAEFLISLIKPKKGNIDDVVEYGKDGGWASMIREHLNACDEKGECFDGDIEPESGTLRWLPYVRIRVWVEPYIMQGPLN